MSQQEIVREIQELSRRRHAVILVHNYQPPEVQDIADVLGDSLELSRKAAETDAEVIVFCGVHFMAETAAMLNPGRTVLLPAPDAGCPMADMIDAPSLRKLKEEHPGAAVVTYINSTAAVKAESDICCTSANAVDIVGNIAADEIIFTPDKYLGQYVAAQTGKKFVYWNGYCPVHVRILPEYVEELKRVHTEAEVLAHPEAPPSVTRLADRVLSTTGMCRYAAVSAAREFIVCTEVDILHRLRRDNPGKVFHPATDLARCVNMKKNSLLKVRDALRDMKHVVTVDPATCERALQAVTRMLGAAGK